MLSKSSSSRLQLIDLLRGFTIISMVAYHFVWDMVFLYGHRWKWFYHSELWQQSICWTFIILSGFCFSLGRNPLKRGIIVFSAGVLVSVVTILIMPSSKIIFGILTLIGTSMLLLVPLRRLFEKIPSVLGMVVSFALFVMFKNCAHGYLGIKAFRVLKLPDFLYKNYVTTFLGFPKSDFFSSDYFPLFPWFFLFVFGYFLYNFFESKDLCKKLLSKGHLPVINFIGRHSLLIYLIHQPIIYGACEIIKLI